MQSEAIQNSTPGEEFVQRIYALLEKDPQATSILRSGMGTAPATAPDQYELLLDYVPDVLSGEEQIPYFVVATLIGCCWPQPSGAVSQDLIISLRQSIQHPDWAPMSEVHFTNLLGCKDFEELRQELEEIVQGLHAINVRIDFASLLDDLIAWQDPNGRSYVKLYWLARFMTGTAFGCATASDSVQQSLGLH